jgi:Zn-dependent peptidase ImmA (M78 family)
MIGVAHGAQARYRPTQLANAFAAELLLPVQAIQRSRGSTDALAKRYGISRSAAEWHVHNRYPLAEA